MNRITALFALFCLFTIAMTSTSAYGLSPSNSFCLDEDNLYVRNVFNVSQNGDETEIATERIKVCNYGCSNSTISTFGGPECIESDFTIAVFFIVLVVAIVLFIRWVVSQ